MIGGLSIIFDKAVRVGDSLKVGETLGTVDSIGLRSTRIRTLDRTIVSVPNGQIANVSIETLSVRDKFWFHHFIGLCYETTSAQLRTVVDETRSYLAAHPLVDGATPSASGSSGSGRFLSISKSSPMCSPPIGINSWKRSRSCCSTSWGSSSGTGQ